MVGKDNALGLRLQDPRKGRVGIGAHRRPAPAARRNAYQPVPVEPGIVHVEDGLRVIDRVPLGERGLLTHLAARLQELAFGGLSKPIVRTLDALADEIEGKKVRKSVIADPRNPIIGTRLIRDWKGTEHTVVVAKDGFDWNGQRFKSLSAVAKVITGTSWNGYRFFGLRQAEGGR